MRTTIEGRHLAALVGLIVALLPAATAIGAPPPAATTWTGRVEAAVLDATTGEPIAGARISGPGDLAGLTDAGGLRAATVSLSAPENVITVTISAPGYGDWLLSNVRVLADDTLYLTARLGPEPIIQEAPQPTTVREPLSRAELEALLDLPPNYVDQTQWGVPQQIRVRVTGYPHCDLSRPYTVQTIDFRQYLKNVLPNEWGASWARESVRAGAVAVKMYAWYMITLGGKWPDADVYDSTCDQVYNPAIAYASTNAAVDDTFDWRLTLNGKIFPTYYRAYAYQCADAGLTGRCLGQWDSKSQADAGQTFEQILTGAYTNSRLNFYRANYTLWFNGSAFVNAGRVQVPIDTGARGADVGGADFTLEFWLKALPGQNMAFDAARTPANTCGVNDGWIKGSVVLDRDIVGAAQHGDYGLALAGGRVAFGLNNGLIGTTLCGATDVTDGAWHHVAVTRQRSDGWLRIWVDGRLDAEVDGPDGDISYLDGRTGGAVDPFLVIGGRKIDSDPVLKPSFTGWLDELRFSDAVRYTAAFEPGGRLAIDNATTSLYRFDEGAGAGACTGAVGDAFPASPPGSGACIHGGSPAAPLWVVNDNPRVAMRLGLAAILNVAVPPATPTPVASPTPVIPPTSTPVPANQTLWMPWLSR